MANVFGLNTTEKRTEVIEGMQLSQTALGFIYHITKCLMGELVEEDKTSALKVVAGRANNLLRAIKNVKIYPVGDETNHTNVADLHIIDVRAAISILALRINLCKERLQNFKNEVYGVADYKQVDEPGNVCGYEITHEESWGYHKDYFHYNNSTLVAMQKLHDEMLYSLIQVDYINL